MAERSPLFSNELDRASFSAYFLGAVIPLVALAVVVERFALPTLSDRNDELGLVVLVISAAVLSLGSFFVLRRLTRQSLERMKRDNHRLDTLLAISSQLASVQHLDEAADRATEQTLDLVEAQSAYLYLRGEDGTPNLSASAGEGASKTYDELQERLDGIAEMIFESQRPLLRGSDDENAGYAALAVPLPGDAEPAGVLVAVRPEPAEDFSVEETDALATLAAQATVALNNGDLRDAQRNFFAHVTDMLVNALDTHLDFNQGHSHRVAQLANRVGRVMGLDDTAMQRLHFAALLHDIGMLKLDRSQKMNRKTCDKHTIIGSRMLGQIRLWKEIAPIVYHHHEWFDGSGYPDGISQHEIPLEARIIAVCDAFDSMTSPSSYRDPRSLDEALDELDACKGTQFDPEVVVAFRGLAEAGHVSV